MLGLIDVRLGDGTYLKRTDSPLLPLAIEWGLLLGAKHSTDLVEARSELEVLFAGLAAERRDEDQLEQMRRCVETMRTTSDNAEFVRADVAFHLAIAQASGNESLLQIMRSIRSLLEVWIKRVAYASGTRPATSTEHAAVFEAIERRDRDAARRAMAGHMEGAAGRLRQTFSEYEQAGGTLDADPRAPRG